MTKNQKAFLSAVRVGECFSSREVADILGIKTASEASNFMMRLKMELVIADSDLRIRKRNIGHSVSWSIVPR